MCVVYFIYTSYWLERSVSLNFGETSFLSENRVSQNSLFQFSKNNCLISFYHKFGRITYFMITLTDNIVNN